MRRAIAEAKKRVFGGGPRPSHMILGKIEDDVNAYIEYVVLLSKAVHGLLAQNATLCPFQIDVVILARQKQLAEAKQEDHDEDEDDDDDDDDCMDVGFGDAMIYLQIPNGGVGALLKKRKIEVLEGGVSTQLTAKSLRTIQTKIQSKMS